MVDEEVAGTFVHFRLQEPGDANAESCSRCCTRCCGGCCSREKRYYPRTLQIGRPPPLNQKFPANVICNQKYNVITFLPVVLYGQFKFFLNFYFLTMAMTQLIDELRVGYLYTYWAPLGFVISITLIREAVDDIRRRSRDKEINSQKYKKLTPKGVIEINSSSIRVGDLLYIEKNQRVPADMVFLRTSDKTGTSFIRTDQLDGETDWKLRMAVGPTQQMQNDADLFTIQASIYAERPQKSIHTFIGTFQQTDDGSIEESLNIENTLWSNTVVASGTVLGLVVYTGAETRSTMNTSHPHDKVGLLDLEINSITKLLFLFTACLSLIMTALKGFEGTWYIYLVRYIVLFSCIIPLSLRVNLDLCKMVCSWLMMRDEDIEGTVVRCTTIPEELGRINYLLSDKTGTLTQNDMVFKRLHLGTVSFGTETMDEVMAHLKTSFSQQKEPSSGAKAHKMRRTVVTRVYEAVKALALCHNVTPVYEGDDTEGESYEPEADQEMLQEVTYQAASPDEVALVSWTESVGLALVKRTHTSMTLKTPSGQFKNYAILQVFPFSSETKRMGIIVKEEESGEITFYMKGADVVMTTIVKFNDWLDEETGNMAREGLRTLVVGKKNLTEEQYQDFENRLHQAKMSVQDRNSKIVGVIESLERDMDLLCLTGVEDKLQENVRPTLELLRNAGIKIWMLTGDKLETATCIAKSSRLVSRIHNIHTFRTVSDRAEAHLELNAFRRKNDCALVITGDSLEVVLRYYEYEFVDLACHCPAVVVCRCSPTQKAEIVKLLKTHTGKQTCAIGDGGNDVSMIQAADAGVGIVGKEGRQASLAADFSITQFSYLAKLLLVHGRYSYKRSAALSQFIIHRGLIISAMQAVFSAVFYFTSTSLFPSILLVGYTTLYTTLPVFSLVLDKDVSAEIAMTYPELYKDLTKGREMSYKMFYIWVLISLYQGGIIMFGALFLFESEFLHVVAITFTALLITELLMVALTVRTWHVLMVVSEILSLGIYIISIVFLPQVFEVSFLTSVDFIWKVVVITSVSCIPLYILKYLRKKFSPPSYSKLQG